MKKLFSVLLSVLMIATMAVVVNAETNKAATTTVAETADTTATTTADSTADTTAAASAESTAQYERLMSYLKDVRIAHPTDSSKTLKLSASEIKAAQNYLSAYITKNELKTATVDTIIAKLDSAIEIFKAAKVASLSDLSSADTDKLIKIAEECGALLNLSVVVDRTAKTIKFVDKTTGATVYTYGSTVKPTGWNMNVVPAAVAGAIIVLAIAGGVIVALKKKQVA